jgi:hypothetical protein
MGDCGGGSAPKFSIAAEPSPDSARFDSILSFNAIRVGISASMLKWR